MYDLAYVSSKNKTAKKRCFDSSSNPIVHKHNNSMYLILIYKFNESENVKVNFLLCKLLSLAN